MTEKIKVMTIFGTRPEAIKMAPLVHALEQSPDIGKHCVCDGAASADARPGAGNFSYPARLRFEYYGIPSNAGNHHRKSLHGLDEVLEQAKPDLVLVHGDTSTTFAGALAAFYHKIPVGHVEAGLRTYDKYSPFPEEMNRKLVGQIAEYAFCADRAQSDNLFREQILPMVCSSAAIRW